MGLESLLGAAGRVVISYKADTSDYERGVRRMAGADKVAGEAKLKALNEQNKSLETQRKGYEALAGKVALAAVASAILVKSVETWGKQSYENQKRVDQITKTLSSGMNDLLGGLGSIVVAFAPVLELASKFASIVGGAAQAIGDAIKWMGESGQNPGAKPVLDEMGVEMGDIPGQWQPKGTRARKEAEARGKSMSLLGVGRMVAGGAADAFRASQDGLSWDDQQQLAWAQEAAAARKKLDDRITADEEAKIKAWDAKWGKKSGPGKKPEETQGIDWDNYSNGGRINGYGVASLDQSGGAEAALAASLGAPEDFDKVSKALFDINEQIGINQQLIDQRRSMASMSVMEQMFGTPGEIEIYSQAFDMLSGSVTSAMGAWIDGSIGAGEAVKRFLAAQLKGLATEAAVNALKSLAMAATYSATPGMQFWVPGALKSAAAWGAVAVAAGAGAAALHSGGGASAGGASPGAPRAPGGGSSAPEGKQTVVIVGDPFADDSPRIRQQRVDRAVNRARPRSGPSTNE